MLSEIVKQQELKLVGIATRTSNKAESNPETAKIPSTLQQYFSNDAVKIIENLVDPAVTYCIYTNYESDFNGEYYYFVGMEVTSFESVAEGLSTLIIPKQTYQKFTVGPGAMPEVCINAWQKIWGGECLIGDREYLADFEIYDHRAIDSQNTILDIYIGIKG